VPLCFLGEPHSEQYFPCFSSCSGFAPRKVAIALLELPFFLRRSVFKPMKTIPMNTAISARMKGYFHKSVEMRNPSINIIMG